MNILIFVLIFLTLITIWQIVKIYELSSKLSDKKFEMVDKKANNLNALLMIVFLIASAIGLYIVSNTFVGRSLYALPAASKHGPRLDWMFNITLIATGFVFILTNILLFYFAYKYKYSEKRKAYYFLDSHKLELIWTVIPAIVMTYLILQGGITWNNVLLTKAPEDHYLIEVTAKQFAWKIRYPGKDGKLGKTIHKLRTPENELGLDITDPDAQDDIIVGGATGYYLPLNKPVLMKINALDVLHSVYLPHFRVKMDAVPGMLTQFIFEPVISTDEMRKNINNEDFNFEMACAELCGQSHFAMKGVVIIDDQKNVDEWLKTKKPFVQTLKEQKMASL